MSSASFGLFQSGMKGQEYEYMISQPQDEQGSGHAYVHR